MRRELSQGQRAGHRTAHATSTIEPETDEMTKIPQQQNENGIERQPPRILKGVIANLLNLRAWKKQSRQWPTFVQWRHFFRSLTPLERIIFVLALLLVLSGAGMVLVRSYLNRTILIPARGGTYTEGMVGQPQFLNPIIAQTSDVDQALTHLLFAGLLTYDKEGKLIEDLAERYATGDFGKMYEVTIKSGALWHDGEPIGADDILFTIQLIQDPAYRSPLFQNWQGVRTEKVDERTVRFQLSTPYAPFLHNLTVGLLPKHRWEDIGPDRFALVPLNLQEPVGSGPWRASRFKKDQTGKIVSYSFDAWDKYFGEKPYIERIRVLFFSGEEEAIDALNRLEVQGISTIAPENLDTLRAQETLNIHEGRAPRYLALFFNQTQSRALADKAVRLALAYATNKQELVEKVRGGFASPVHSPILPELLGYTQETKIYDFSPEHARKNLLEPSGWRDSNEDGVIEKDGESLSIGLATLDLAELRGVAELIKKQWEAIGVNVDVQFFSGPELRTNVIQPRLYQILLFGEALNLDPDPFAFWHSSRKFDPGQNLTLYDNSEVDKLLEEARQNLNPDVRAEKYKAFQQKIVDDLPAIFLYQPIYLYPVVKDMRGIELGLMADPSWRFGNIQEWYLRTKRVWK